MTEFITNQRLKLDRGLMADNAKSVISDRFDFLREIILNSSDNLFGNKFFMFMNGFSKNCSKNPCIPSLSDYRLWESNISKEGKFGNISIYLSNNGLIVKDDGTGIPEELFQTKISTYAHVEEKSTFINDPQIHRRGLFSRGLKEVFIALNNHLFNNIKKKDGLLKIRTAYRDMNGKLKHWACIYHYENNEINVGTFDSHELSSNTYTEIEVSYPSGCQLFKPSEIKRIKKKLEEQLWFQTVFKEHNIRLGNHSGYVNLEPHFDYKNDISILHEEVVKITIPKKEKEIIATLKSYSFEFKINIYRIVNGNELKKSTDINLKNPRITIRGIIICDYSTEYGILKVGNEYATDYLQARVTIPCLRIFSILGSRRNNKMFSIVESNRKDINWQHPILKLIHPKIEKIWKKEVDKERNAQNKVKKEESSKKNRIYIKNVEKYLHRLLTREFKKIEKEIDPSVTSGGTGAINKQNPIYKSRPKSLFGPQYTAHKSSIRISNREERKLKFYFHKDILEKSNKIIIVNSDIPLIGYEGKFKKSAFFALSNSKFDEENQLLSLEISLRSNLQLKNSTHSEIRLKLSYNNKNFNNEHVEIKKFLALEYPDFKVPNNLFYEDDSLILDIPIQVVEPKIDSNKGLIKLEFERDETYVVNPNAPGRKENQSKAKSGWTINLKQDQNFRTYEVQILCRSNFFCGYFDPGKELHEQDYEFKLLLNFAYCCIHSEIITPAAEDDSNSHLNENKARLNSMMPDFMRLDLTSDLK